MSHYLPAIYNTVERNRLFRVAFFSLLSMLIHTVLIFWIKLPANNTTYKIYQPLTINIYQPVQNPQHQQERDKPPVKTATSTSGKTAIVSEEALLATKARPKPSLPVVKQQTIIPQSTRTPLDKVNKPVQPEKTSDPLIFRSEVLKSLSLLPAGTHVPEESFQVFDPELQRRIHLAHEEKLNRQQFHKQDLQFNVDEKSTDIDGYREVVIDGRCWLIPSDTSFNQLDSRTVMLSSICDKPESQLSGLIKSLKPVK